MIAASADGQKSALHKTTYLFGLVDLPAVQQQQSAVLALDAFTHLMAAGAPRSGRSQLLRTIAGALALAHSAADVHLYGIDCGNGALLPLADLPHCGAVVTRTQTERAVATLVLRGLSNARIAASRHCSPRTIANQVHSILHKLGVGSRAELIARVLGEAALQRDPSSWPKA